MTVHTEIKTKLAELKGAAEERKNSFFGGTHHSMMADGLKNIMDKAAQAEEQYRGAERDLNRCKEAKLALENRVAAKRVELMNLASQVQTQISGIRFPDSNALHVASLTGILLRAIQEL
jgi:hypothetical protein